VAGFIGAFIGAHSFVLVWILAGICHLAAWAVTLTLMNDEGEPEVRMTEKQAFAASYRALKVTPSLRWVVAVCVAYGLALPFNYYWSPFFERQVGITGLSWIWALNFGVCALAGFAVRGWKSKWASDGVIIPVCLGLTGLGLAGAGGTAVLFGQLTFTVMHEFGRGAINPLTDAYAQARVASQYRATFGSLMSLLARGGYAVVLVAVWAIGRLIGDNRDVITVTWLASGLALAGLAAILWFLRPRHEKRPTDATS
jgi:hypothetical protein